jgi:hypothetical protein
VGGNPARILEHPGLGRAYQQERDPELWEFLSSSIGVNPDLKTRAMP